jgi:hypothetical protein
MRVAVNVHGHLSAALIGAIALVSVPMAPGVVRLFKDAFAILDYSVPQPKPSIDRAPARVSGGSLHRSPAPIKLQDRYVTPIHREAMQ